MWLKCQQFQISEISAIPSIRRKSNDWETMLSSVGKLYTCGISINWNNFHRYSSGKIIEVPGNHFEETRHWIPINDDKYYLKKSSQISRIFSNFKWFAHLQFFSKLNIIFPKWEKVIRSRSIHFPLSIRRLYLKRAVKDEASTVTKLQILLDISLKWCGGCAYSFRDT